LRFVAEHQRAHARMQPVGPHRQIEAAGAAPRKGYLDAVLILPEPLDRVPEAVFHLVLRELVERLGQIAAHDLHHLHVEGLEGFAPGVQVDAADAPMAFVDKRDLVQGRLLLLQARPDPHQLGHLHGLKAHVNRVPACAQLWRTLDHGRGEPVALEPVRQGWPGNTRP
jgi:hypothetical protein